MIQIGADFFTNNVPETGLAPTITIRDTSDGSIEVDGVNMTEVGGGAYKYDFTEDITKKYRAIVDGGVDTLDYRYMTAWLGVIPTAIEIREEIDNNSTGLNTALKVDVSVEPGQGVPPIDPTIEEMIKYLYFKMRNKNEVTSSEDVMYAVDGTTEVMKSSLSDDGTTFTKSEYTSGA